MDLFSIREQFVKLSGRADLVNADGSDNGANFYINAGQRLLDRYVPDGPNALRWYYSKVSSEGFMVMVPSPRSIERVYIVTDEQRVELLEKSAGEFLYQYSQVSPDKGTPKYYAIISARQVEEMLYSTQSSFERDGFTDYQRLVWGLRNLNKTVILVSPPADGTYTVEVLGRFLSPELGEKTLETEGTRTDSTTYTIGQVLLFSDQSVWQVSTAGTTGVGEPSTTDTTEGNTVSDGSVTWTKLADSVTVYTQSYWTEVEPFLLIQAALATHERSLRNSEGFQDYVNSIREELNSIDSDQAEDGPVQMNDSWEM